MSARTKVIIGFVILVAAVVIFFKTRKPHGLDLPVAEVTHLPSFQPWGTCNGRPKTAAESYLSVQTGGRVETLHVKTGDLVGAGQILGIVDQTARGAKLKAALSSFRLAQKDFSRVAGLFSSGVAAKEEYDRLQGSLEVKRAELEGAKQDVEDGIMRAPISGRVSTIVFKVGDRVPDGGRVLAIEAPSVLQMSCRIGVSIAEQLPPESDVTWKTIDDAKPVAIKSRAKITGQAGAGGFVGSDREIQITTDGQQLAALQGHLVEANIPLQAISNVLKVPSDAVVRRDGEYYILTRVKKSAAALKWTKVDVIKRTSDDAFLRYSKPDDLELLRVTKELSSIENFVKKDKA